MPVTQKVIATLAGVSVGTVDRVLNNRGHVNPEVADRILKISKELNYRTNTVAKSLAMRKRKLKIAVVLHIQQNDFYDAVLSGIRQAQEEIRDYGIEISVFHCNDFDHVQQCALIAQALAEGATALVIVPINHPMVVEKLNQAIRDNILVVFLCAVLNDVPCFSAVHCDYARSGRIGGGVINLLSGGKADVLYFTPTLSMLGHAQRIDGFRGYLNTSPDSMKIADVVVVPNDTIDTYNIVSRALKAHPESSYALFCGNTKAWLRAVADCGRAITTVAYDDPAPTREALKSGALSAAILQNPTSQGYEAIMLLFRYFTSAQTPKPEILVENKIILKEFID